MKLHVIMNKINANENQGSKRQKWRIVLIFVLLIAMIGGSICFFRSRQEKNGLYYNIKWGSSLEKIESNVADLDYIESGNSGHYKTSNYENMKGVNATIDYYLDDSSGLFKVRIMMAPSEESSYTSSEVAEQYTEKFNKLYGEYWKESKLYVWETKESKIELGYDPYNGFILIVYQDITKAEN